MVLCSLQCAIVGQARSSFDVEIDGDVKAGANAWLSSLTEDAKRLKKGEKTALIESLTQENNKLQGEDSISKYLEGVDAPTTKKAYQIVWDLAFRCVLDLIFSQARIDRDSCDDCPDFLFILDDVCVFRSEETSPEVSISVAANELCSKLVWGFGSVPYVFGYAASGYNVTLFALHRDDNGVVKNTAIGTFNLKVQEHKFEVVLAILNMALLFPAIVEACPASGKNEFMTITRSSGVVVRLFPTFVRKVFPDTSRLDHLIMLYGQMAAADVPNVDRLIKICYHKRSLSFEPRGTMVRPSNLLELLGALRDVLQALVALHGLGWIHRDIRWPNVIRQREGDSWFLIDCADAATSPQPSFSGQHLSRDEHAPEILWIMAPTLLLLTVGL
ncbi:unnamed protein product [Phytophthora lilii]|uniref:Unnamed protein product n=1 Tax=Phytophthora lilii TaxID=2077276 RepID=A0A9W6WP85_9STRA|nr:unnamed protein product [Phytophthora lilii]